MPIKKVEKNTALLRDSNESYILKLIKEETLIPKLQISHRGIILAEAASGIVYQLFQKILQASIYSRKHRTTSVII